MCMYVSFVYMSAIVCRDQKRASGHLKLELCALMEHLPWVLGEELQSSARSAITLTY